ncbi:MAG: hypothetical protein RSE32_12520 [Comamonas sp.]|uniref:hypothetical protein n=1 Tax=Comamonas sp. TaxID=34028 RepID=UPI002FCBD7E3
MLLNQTALSRAVFYASNLKKQAQTLYKKALTAINLEAPYFIPKQAGLTKLRDTGIATLNIFKEIN